MRLPRPISPSELKVELCRRGHAVSERALIDWRQKGMLPLLQSRGRGQGKGKKYYWWSPRIIDHAAGVDELMKLNVPNDEARLIIWLSGFPVRAEKIREAWLSRLGKLETKLDLEKREIIEDRGSEFTAVEDEISALTAKYARKLAVQFGLDRDQSAQILIDLFGLIFKQGYSPDIDFPIETIDLIAQAKIIPPPDQLELKPTEHIAVITKFIRDHMSFSAVNSTVASTSDIGFNHAHRRWRRFLRILSRAMPDLADDKSGKFLAAGFGRLMVPVIIQLNRDGRTGQIDQSITIITQLITQTELAGIIGKIIQGNNIGPPDIMALGQLSAALLTLGNVWDYHDFPFAVLATK